MATVTYQQFYYLPDDEFIELEGLNAYFEHHKNYDLYKDEMYCPECLQCKLLIRQLNIEMFMQHTSPSDL